MNHLVCICIGVPFHSVTYYVSKDDFKSTINWLIMWLVHLEVNWVIQEFCHQHQERTHDHPMH